VVVGLTRYTWLDQIHAAPVYHNRHTAACRYCDADGPPVVIGNPKDGDALTVHAHVFLRRENVLANVD
jgi:hypothetical protein